MSDKEKNQKKGGNPLIWFGATGILLIAALAVVYWAYTENRAQSEAMAAPAAGEDGLPAYNVPNWIKGNPDADNHIIVYSDYGCIHCARFHSVVEAFMEEYGDIIAFEKRHYPINNNFHSRAAAVASVAAGKQGKYWEMSNLLYYNTEHWRTENPAAGFMGMAEYLELDLEQFEKDLYDEDVMYEVVRGHMAAREFGIRATPTVYLNGEQIQAQASPELLYERIFGEAPASE
jgi:protein-disulfide isomerase